MEAKEEARGRGEVRSCKLCEVIEWHRKLFFALFDGHPFFESYAKTRHRTCSLVFGSLHGPKDEVADCFAHESKVVQDFHDRRDQGPKKRAKNVRCASCKGKEIIRSLDFVGYRFSF
jgi:hypothetical protein